jgi:S-phase kinase-associated protein 1
LFLFIWPGCADPTDEETIEIPFDNVDPKMLKKIIEFCEHHVAEPMSVIEQPLKSTTLSEVVQPYYADFVTVDDYTLKDMLMAANFMDIKPLLELGCAAVARLVLLENPSSPAEIRRVFDMETEDDRAREAQRVAEIDNPPPAPEQEGVAEIDNPAPAPGQEGVGAD